jgi:hypothetical protein
VGGKYIGGMLKRIVCNVACIVIAPSRGENTCIVTLTSRDECVYVLLHRTLAIPIFFRVFSQ